MGLIATLLRLARGKTAVKGNAPGKAVVMQGEGVEGQVLEPVVYQAPGVFGIPGDGVRGVCIPLGNSSREKVVIAVLNYQVEIDVGGAGGAALYSTTPDGKTVKAKVVVKPDGTIALDGVSVEINGNGKRLVTFDELDAAMQTFRTALNLHTHPTAASGPPSPPTAPMSIDISAAKTTTVKTGG